ncbi:hypothetical protein BDW66DRAFT_14480 [Aspergillus desertorum]
MNSAHTNDTKRGCPVTPGTRTPLELYYYRHISIVGLTAANTRQTCTLFFLSELIPGSIPILSGNTGHKYAHKLSKLKRFTRFATSHSKATAGTLILSMPSHLYPHSNAVTRVLHQRPCTQERSSRSSEGVAGLALASHDPWCLASNLIFRDSRRSCPKLRKPYSFFF